MQRKLLDDDFTLADFRDQMRQLRKLGPLESILGMMPQIGPMKDLKNMKVDEKEITRLVAIVDSMTPQGAQQSHDHQRRAAAADREGSRERRCRK